jgi:hypothetical protein
MKQQIKQYVAAPFLVQGKLAVSLLIIFVGINSLVLVNALVHHPAIGYDADDHLHYIVNAHHVLTTFRLPTEGITKEFFSPPLPYALPTLFYTLMKPLCEYWGLGTTPYAQLDYCLIFTGKFAQLLNVLYSLVLTFYLLKICDRIRPGDLTLKISSLGLLGMLPVYYKTFSFVRGEPLVALFSVLVVYQFVTMMLQKEGVGGQDVLVLGVFLGLLFLSRQWGFFVLPALFVSAGLYAFICTRRAKSLVTALVLSLCLAGLISGWFYVLLHVKTSQLAAFNRQTSGFSLSNQPAKFYVGLGLQDFELFTRPTRSSFRNQMIPIFYADLWGDYWTRFSVTGYDPVHGYDWSPEASNWHRMRPYLGRVNLLALFPTALFLAGCGIGFLAFTQQFRARPLATERDTSIFSLLLWIIVISLAGYFGFLISYPSPNKGDTIKATYMLHIFPFLAILAGEFLRRLKIRFPRIYQLSLGMLLLIFLHNAPAILTHYSHFRVGW